jgi:hypothetical protein
MKIDLSKHTDAIKIDAMFFSVTEEPIILKGDESL